MRIVVGPLVAAAFASVSLAACGSSSPPSSATPSSATTESSVAPSAQPASQPTPLDRWIAAYTFLSAQTEPTEISCTWLTSAGSALSPAPRPAKFYGFAESAAWKDHLITRNDPYPSGSFESCVATIPTTVPYGPEIRTFLSRVGLRFAADPSGTESLTPVEIAYAGQDAEDPDIIYRDKPGLFGLRMALAGLGDDAFKAGTSEIVQPTADEAATRYLRYATPLLNWYQYKP
jgi:hypothetical protein